MDLGECPKIHDLALRADYQQAASARDCFYDVEVRLKWKPTIFSLKEYQIKSFFHFQVWATKLYYILALVASMWNWGPLRVLNDT